MALTCNLSYAIANIVFRLFNVKQNIESWHKNRVISGSLLKELLITL